VAAGPAQPAGPERRSHHRQPSSGRQVVSLLAVSALAVAVLLAFVFVRLHRRPAAAPTRVVAGDCVAAPAGELLRVVGCAAPDASARAVRALADRPDNECPADTDLAVATGGTLLCLVNLRAPHPGVPGQGGGVIRAGDCVANPATGQTEELVCAKGGYYAIVLARVDRTAQCPPPASEALSLRAAIHPVACLRPRAEVGSCIDRPTVGPPDPVPCTDRRAVGKVLARAVTAGRCPVHTTNTVNALFGLPGKRVICLTRPR
jgi:hypothetical protein